MKPFISEIVNGKTIGLTNMPKSIKSKGREKNLKAWAVVEESDVIWEIFMAKEYAIRYKSNRDDTHCGKISLKIIPCKITLIK